jgi:hypothetical protein
MSLSDLLNAILKALLWPVRVGYTSLIHRPFLLLTNPLRFQESGQKWAKAHAVWPMVVFALMLFTLLVGDKLPAELWEKPGMYAGQAALIAWGIGIFLSIPVVKRMIDAKIPDGTNTIQTGELAVFALLLPLWPMVGLQLVAVTLSFALYFAAKTLPETQLA